MVAQSEVPLLERALFPARDLGRLEPLPLVALVVRPRAQVFYLALVMERRVLALAA